MVRSPSDLISVSTYINSKNDSCPMCGQNRLTRSESFPSLPDSQRSIQRSIEPRKHHLWTRNDPVLLVYQREPHDLHVASGRRSATHGIRTRNAPDREKPAPHGRRRSAPPEHQQGSSDPVRTASSPPRPRRPQRGSQAGARSCGGRPGRRGFRRFRTPRASIRRDRHRSLVENQYLGLPVLVLPTWR